MIAATAFEPGTTLRVNHGLYWHFGIVGFDGHVIHNSKERGKVVSEPLPKFAGGNDVLPCEQIRSQNWLKALQRAYSAIGTPYNLWVRNCEHFVRWAHGLIAESPQIQRAILITSGLTLSTATKGNASAMITGLGIAAGALLPLKKPIYGSLLVGVLAFLFAVSGRS